MNLDNVKQELSDKVDAEGIKKRETEEKVRAILTDLYLAAAVYGDVCKGEEITPEKAKEEIDRYLRREIEIRPYAKA